MTRRRSTKPQKSKTRPSPDLPSIPIYPKKKAKPARITPRKEQAMTMSDRVPVLIAKPEDVEAAFWVELQARVDQLRADVDDLIIEAANRPNECRGRDGTR